uniref:Uncharacterized protein n=1 Tax=Rhodnius prolixus TaxID=13249 RepID=T1IAT1_RHOPR
MKARMRRLVVNLAILFVHFGEKSRISDEVDGTVWVWKNGPNNNQVWHFSRISGIEKSTLEVMGQNVAPLQVVNAILKAYFAFFYQWDGHTFLLIN